MNLKTIEIIHDIRVYINGKYIGNASNVTVDWIKPVELGQKPETVKLSTWETNKFYVYVIYGNNTMIDCLKCLKIPAYNYKLEKEDSKYNLYIENNGEFQNRYLHPAD